jgi:Flp pilus assembly protein TadG
VRAADRDEGGAVTVLVAMLMIALMTLVAFTADLGQAYVSKRQLQTAADASALAAASVYAKYPGSCSTLAANGSYRTEAQSAADDYRERNRAGSAGSPIDVHCNTEGELEVGYTATGSTPSVFGQLATGEESITTSRSASALVDVPSSASHGVRPFAMCSVDIPHGPMPTGVVEIKPPGAAHSGSACGASEAGGNWWYVTCDLISGGQSDGAPQNMASAIQLGCANKISVVKPQTSTSPAGRSLSLTTNCHVGSPATSSCLDGDTGNSSLKNVAGYTAWESILGQTIILPVFCSDPTCVPDTPSGSGTNSRYPVYQLTSVVVCGFHIYNKSSRVTSAGNCAGNSYTPAYVSSLGNNDVYFYFKFVRLQTSEDTSLADCALDAACDGGLRRVHLSQ